MVADALYVPTLAITKDVAMEIVFDNERRC
jgi:hypothetical protein